MAVNSFFLNDDEIAVVKAIRQALYDAGHTTSLADLYATDRRWLDGESVRVFSMRGLNDGTTRAFGYVGMTRPVITRCGYDNHVWNKSFKLGGRVYKYTVGAGGACLRFSHTY